jgi:Protein of unknown function (DUF2971).
MKLFKYVTSDRIDILLNGKIRLTQPYIWNDPFELQPYYKDYIPKNPLSQLLKLSKMIQNPSQFTIEELEEYEKERKRITKDDIYSFINKNIVGLSLTKEKDDLLMWAHYASQHSGFVLEFETESDFFQKHDRYLIKVGYDNTRPDVNTSEFAESIVNIIELLKENKKLSDEEFIRISSIFRKSTEWEYEQEWRLITTVNNAINFGEFEKNMNVIEVEFDSEINRTYHGENYKAFFNIPISCIKAVYCGARMKRRLIRKLFFLTKFNINYTHINLLCSEIDDKLYKINFREVTELDVLSMAEFSYEQDANKKRLKYKLDYSVYKYEKEKKFYSNLNSIIK